MKIFLLILLNAFICTEVTAQPDESTKLFNVNDVARIDVTISPETLTWIYANIHADTLFPASMRFKNSIIDETIDSIAFGIRGNTSREAGKKSFKISFNDFIQGREFYGVDKMNLNGEHNDPSIIRSKICFDFYHDIGMPASRAGYTEVYINGDYYGLYISVEHIDDEFIDKKFKDDTGNLWKCLWPADLTYIGADPDLYKMVEENRRTYELMTNEDDDDYSNLARLIKIINNIPGNVFADSLEKILDVADVLKYFAINVLTGSWDDYWSLMNNYYLYHNPSEDRFHWIPFDYDNSLGVDWFDIDWVNADPYNFPKVNAGYRPLASKLMSNPQYRSLYTHFIRFISENVFKLSVWETRLDSIKLLITPFAEADLYRTMDYGFSVNDFHQSYSTSYSNQHVKKGIKQFVNERYQNINSWLSDINAAPVVYGIEVNPPNLSASDSIFVFAAAYDFGGISSAVIRFYPDNSSDSIDYQMIFSPVSNTKIIEESDRWVGVIPPLGEGKSGSFKIVVNDQDGNALSYPRHKNINVRTPGSAAGVLINEIMAGNTKTIQDEAQEYEDWIELYNPTTEDITISGMYLTDKSDNLIKWKIPGDTLSIKAGGYVLIWCDEDEEQGLLHSNFKLRASGEFVALTSQDGVTVIDSITFGIQADDISFGRRSELNQWQFFNQPTPGSSNTITAVEDDNFIPTAYKLEAYPNPFNPVTKIKFSIPDKKRTAVKIKLFNIIGREIKTLLNEEVSAGTHEFLFNGNGLTSGIYFVKLITDNYSSAIKLILLK